MKTSSIPRVGLVLAVLVCCCASSGCAWWRSRTVVAAEPPAGPGSPGPQKPDIPGPEKPDRPPEKEPEPLPPPPPPPEPEAVIPVARRVPGREGMVFSPYNNKLVDVEGMASGTVVADPHYPAAEKKYFRVP